MTLLFVRSSDVDDTLATFFILSRTVSISFSFNDTFTVVVIFVYLKDGNEGKYGVEHGTGVGNQHLLLFHVEGRHEELRGRQRAPDDDHARADSPEDA